MDKIQKERKPVHIIANKGVNPTSEFAIMSGDPNRMKDIAQRFLYNSKLFNDNRCELGYVGYTSEHDGAKIIAQGHGIGRSSISIYAIELIRFYGVKVIIRLGTCGAYKENMKLGDLVIPSCAYSDKDLEKLPSNALIGMTPSQQLFTRAKVAAKALGLRHHVGIILATDYFHPKKGHELDWQIWAEHDVIGVDMESDLLFEIGHEEVAHTLTLLTVSDNFTSEEEMTDQQRTECGENMFNVAREIINNCK